MNKIIIGIIVFVIILIALFFYLKNSCPEGKYFSTSDFKCVTCTKCPKNYLGIPEKWYKPGESCKGFTDRICLDYTMHECSAGERTIQGTVTKDRYCQSISDCYRECGPNKYASGEENCWGARGRTMTCNNCTQCSEDEIDIKNETCSGRDSSNIQGFYSRIVNSKWVPMSCEGNINRVCLNKNYIKYNNDISYNIVFNSSDSTLSNILSNIPLQGYDNIYYNSNIPQSLIDDINLKYFWNKISIVTEDLSNTNPSTAQWKIRGANLDNVTFNNCPVENNDVIYFYREFNTTDDTILCAIKTNDNKYDIGTIQVPKAHHHFPRLASSRNKIYIYFKIENFVNFQRNILVSNLDSSEKYFNLQLVNKDGKNTNKYLGLHTLTNPALNIIRLFDRNDSNINENLLKININKFII